MTPAETAAAAPPKALADRLFAPIDIASLVYFRIAFGIILLADVLLDFSNGWIGLEYVRPRFHFAYYGFGWLHPWPGNGMYIHFAVLGVLAFCITIGFAYRASAILFFLGFTYTFLLEESVYLNHYYLVGLVSFLMIFVPAHHKLSVDAWLRPNIASDFAPAWSLWVLRGQMGVVYFFGGIAKLNADWLQGWPLRLWLPHDLTVPILSAFRDETWLALFFSYSGLCLDLFAVPLLLWRKTRVYMFGVLALFHLTNNSLFEIGIFPWFATAMTALYFEPDWPRRVLHGLVKLMGGSPPPAPVASTSNANAGMNPQYRCVILAGLAVYSAIQILAPLRHWLYPGNPSWTEQGHRFSWRMKLHDKRGSMTFTLTDPENGRSWTADIAHYLPAFQYTSMAWHPDMILAFANYLADRETRRGHQRLEVRADVELSLNGREPQPIIDPEVNLASLHNSLWPKPWITTLIAPRTGGAVP